MLLKILAITVLTFLMVVFASCSIFNDSCNCPAKNYKNVCVSGKYIDQDSIFFTQERKSGKADTIAVSAESIQNQKACFSEQSELQRIIVYQKQARIDSSGWFQQEKVDCCRYKDTTLTF